MGAFKIGNAEAAVGGRARAAKLSPERRREIALAGLQAIADRLFDGDLVAAGRYISARGAMARRAAAARRRAEKAAKERKP